MNIKEKNTCSKQKQSRNMVIISLMQDTGWSRSKVEDSLKELERFNLIKFPEVGGMIMKIGEAK